MLEPPPRPLRSQSCSPWRPCSASPRNKYCNTVVLSTMDACIHTYIHAVLLLLLRMVAWCRWTTDSTSCACCKGFPATPTSSSWWTTAPARCQFPPARSRRPPPPEDRCVSINSSAASYIQRWVSAIHIRRWTSSSPTTPWRPAGTT